MNAIFCLQIPNMHISKLALRIRKFLHFVYILKFNQCTKYICHVRLNVVVWISSYVPLFESEKGDGAGGGNMVKFRKKTNV